MDVTDIVARLEERAVLNDNPTYREAAAALREMARELEIQDKANDILTSQLSEARATLATQAAVIKTLELQKADQAATIEGLRKALLDARFHIAIITHPPLVADMKALCERIDAALEREGSV